MPHLVKKVYFLFKEDGHSFEFFCLVRTFTNLSIPQNGVSQISIHWFLSNSEQSFKACVPARSCILTSYIHVTILKFYETAYFLRVPQVGAKSWQRWPWLCVHRPLNPPYLPPQESMIAWVVDEDDPGSIGCYGIWIGGDHSEQIECQSKSFEPTMRIGQVRHCYAHNYLGFLAFLVTGIRLLMWTDLLAGEKDVDPWWVGKTR